MIIIIWFLVVAAAYILPTVLGLSSHVRDVAALTAFVGYFIMTIMPSLLMDDY